MKEKVKLDTVDSKIIASLDIDSRKPISAIAKENKLSKNVVNYRINSLISKGIISSFYTVIDTTKLGYEGYRIYLKWQYIKPEKEKEIIDYLVEKDVTWWVGTIEGEWNIAILVWVKNTNAFREFWLELMSKYQKYIIRYLISVYTKVYDYNYAFLSPEKKPKIVVREVGTAEPVKITGKQEKILKILAQSSRMPTVEIAKTLGLTPMIVKYNIKKLKKAGIIKGFRIKINTELLKYTYYKINFYLKDKSQYNEILSYCEAHPNIVYVNEAVGFADFEAELLAEDYSKFQEIVQEMKSIFGDTIREQNYFIYSKIHKIRYF